MAQKGALNLESEPLLEIYNSVKEYETVVQDALYEQYKVAYKISLTNYMRGKAADSFKTYFSRGTINMIQGLLDISSEMTMIIQFITEMFYQFESGDEAKINEGTLDGIEGDLAGEQKIYNDMENELFEVLNVASQYIDTTAIEVNTVNDSYSSVREKIQSIRENLYTTDDEALQSAKELLIRINELKDFVNKTMGFCYKDGNFIPDNIDKLPSQNWYSEQSNATLSLLLAEDPFAYEAGEVSVNEDQWAAGLCSDVYAYAGYSFLNASYEGGVEDSTAFVRARASVMDLNGYAQFTDYVRAEAEIKGVYGSADAKIGAGSGYLGAHVKAEAGVANANGIVVVGNNSVNAFVKGDASFLCADGKAAFEFEDNGQYAVGVSASASVLSASAKGGVSLFKYKVKDGSATAQKTDNLFKVNVKGEATVGAAFKAYAQSETAVETDFVNINATSLDLEIGLGLDIEVSVTVPTLYLKLPW